MKRLRCGYGKRLVRTGWLPTQRKCAHHWLLTLPTVSGSLYILGLESHDAPRAKHNSLIVLLRDPMANIGSVNVTAPTPSISQPTQIDGYMVVAQELFQALEILSTASISPRAAALIAAHALECLLSAFLLHKNVDTRRDSETWHNLVVLWERASEQGLPIDRRPPNWVTILGSGHNRPFFLRYQRGKKETIVQGGETPELTSMRDELRKLLEVVNLAVRS